MKKANLLIAISVLSIGLLLAGCSNSKGTASSSSSSSSSSKASSSQTSSSSSSSSSSMSESSSNAASSSSQQQTSMNLAEIAQGNFESIQGVWKNGKGEIITISGNTVTGAVLNNKIFTFTDEKLVQGIAVASTNPSGLGPSTVLSFMFAPKSVSPTGIASDGTDTTKDRLIFASNGGTSLFLPNGGALELFYYRTTQ